MTKRPFTTKGLRAEQPLELVHSDVCGQFSIQARGGYEYYVTSIDNYFRYGYVYLMHRKSETFDKFKEFHAEAKKQLGKSLKVLRLNRGGDYMNFEFTDYLIKNGRELSFSKILLSKAVHKKFSCYIFFSLY